MRGSRNRFLFWAIIAAIVSGQLLLVGILVSNQATGEAVIGYVTGALLPSLSFVFNLLQKNDLRVYIFVEKIRALFKATAPAWHLAVNLTGENITPDTLDTITKRLVAFKVDSSAISLRKINHSLHHIILSPGPTLEVAYSQGSQSPSDYEEETVSRVGYLQITIRNYNVDYRRTAYALDKQIIPMLEIVTNAILNVRARYTLIIEYTKDNNPFLGLYIARVDPKLMTSFEVSLRLDETNKVEITQTKVAIHTQSQNALRNLALEFLTFDRDLGERLQNAK